MKAELAFNGKDGLAIEMKDYLSRHEVVYESPATHGFDALGRSTIFEKVNDYAAFEQVLQEAQEQVIMLPDGIAGQGYPGNIG